MWTIRRLHSRRKRARVLPEKDQVQEGQQVTLLLACSCNKKRNLFPKSKPQTVFIVSQKVDDRILMGSWLDMRRYTSKNS